MLNLQLTKNLPTDRHYKLARSLAKSFREKIIKHDYLSKSILNSYEEKFGIKELHQKKYHCEVVLLNKALIDIGIGYTLENVRGLGYLLSKKDEVKARKFGSTAFTGYQTLERAELVKSKIDNKSLANKEFWNVCSKYNITKKNIPRRNMLTRAMELSVKLLTDAQVPIKEQ